MKTFVGVITSLKNAQTARVKVERSWQHPLYKKYVKRSRNFACHIEDVKVELGDKVSIQECRPLSATKRFKVVGKVGDQS